MKPITVEFQAFGPYAGHEIVEFDKLASKGLFLICGKTGIGKTMLLDAITFALYGKSSGHGRDDFSAMRCTRAEYDATTFVKFVFENKGVYYSFERRIERKKKNLSLSYSLLFKDESGVWQTMLENPKEKDLNAKAVEIIGLEYEQFCQVIILPQGKFEKLLVSNSDEKEKILTSIFGEEKWQKIAEYFFAEADARLGKLRDIREKIQRSLRDESCETFAELDRLISSKQSEADQLTDEYISHHYDDIIKEQQDLLAVASRFEDLRNADAKKTSLEAQKQERSLWEKKSEDAERAEKVRTFLAAVITEKENVESREKELESAQDLMVSKGEALNDAETQLRNHLEKAEEYASKNQLKIKFEGLREEYASVDEATDELNEKSNSLNKALEDESKAQEEDETLKKALSRIKDEYESLQKNHNDMLEAYMNGITGELAGKLKEGEPCPVCGSTQHPHKAPIADNNVTKEAVESAKEEADIKYQELKASMTKEESAKKRFDEKHAAAEEAKRSVEVSKVKLEGLRKKMISDIDSLQVLEENIKKLINEITEYNNTKEKLENLQKTAKDNYTEACTHSKSAEKELESATVRKSDAEKKLMVGLKANGFLSAEEAESAMLSDEERKQLRDSISQYDAEVSTANESYNRIKAELEGKPDLDSQIIRQTIEETQTAIDEFKGKKAVLDNEIQRLRDKDNKLKEEGAGIEEDIREAEEDALFARRLRGERGTGLQRYVLGIMFSTVIAAANKMLEKIHGGRYRLFRSDEKAQGSTKRGLELKAYDRLSADHEGRFVNSLSGGEKFLVSLALSIGMSTIAQKSGIRIEALFIDEGFGSLDEDSINDAMDVLNSIQRSNGIVGIISHVKLLQEQIPTKLCVEANEKGSYISSTIG